MPIRSRPTPCRGLQAASQKWDGFSVNPGTAHNFTFAIHIHPQGSDGSSLKLHDVAHAVFESNENLRISFDKATWYSERG